MGRIGVLTGRNLLIDIDRRRRCHIGSAIDMFMAVGVHNCAQEIVCAVVISVVVDSVVSVVVYVVIVVHS